MAGPWLGLLEICGWSCSWIELPALEVLGSSWRQGGQARTPSFCEPLLQPWHHCCNHATMLHAITHGPCMAPLLQHAQHHCRKRCCKKPWALGAQSTVTAESSGPPEEEERSWPHGQDAARHQHAVAGWRGLAALGCPCDWCGVVA